MSSCLICSIFLCSSGFVGLRGWGVDLSTATKRHCWSLPRTAVAGWSRASHCTDRNQTETIQYAYPLCLVLPDGFKSDFVSRRCKLANNDSSLYQNLTRTPSSRFTLPSHPPVSSVGVVFVLSLLVSPLACIQCSHLGPRQRRSSLQQLWFLPSKDSAARVITWWDNTPYNACQYCTTQAGPGRRGSRVQVRRMRGGCVLWPCATLCTFHPNKTFSNGEHHPIHILVA